MHRCRLGSGCRISQISPRTSSLVRTETVPHFRPWRMDANPRSYRGCRAFNKRDGNGIDTVIFDHRPFAEFYEGVTGSSFLEDYEFGRGRDYVSGQLKGLRVAVDGEPFNETV